MIVPVQVLTTQTCRVEEHPALVEACRNYMHDVQAVRVGLLGNAARSREWLRHVYRLLKTQQIQ